MALRFAFRRVGTPLRSYSTKPKIMVAMSGGVDSSVTALLLQRQGYHVEAMFMKNWDQVEEGIPCQAEKDWEDVQKVCDHLGIERHRVNFVAEYWNDVFETVLAEFRKGLTPNPDILCNREIKFKAFLNKALSLGATHVATGHYCQIRQPREPGGKPELLRGADRTKDQSYFLAAVTWQALQTSLFPIGHMRKSEVKRLAAENGLITASKKESMGICFIGKRRFEDFIGEYITQVPGEIRLVDGSVVGEHRGMCTLTIGQKARLGGMPEKLFVVAKDVPNNVVYVAPGGESPLMYLREARAISSSWISGEAPGELGQAGWRGEAQVRHLHRPATLCAVTWDPDAKEEGSLLVRFDEPVKAITPGQTVVFYQGEVCLGCATIAPIEHEFFKTTSSKG